MELGFELRLIGIRDDCLGGADALRDALLRSGQELSASTELWRRPSIRRVRTSVLKMILNDQVDLVIGSSIELATLKREPRLQGRFSRVSLLEFGFPSQNHHESRRTSTLGYPGVLAWVQRLGNALRTR